MTIEAKTDLPTKNRGGPESAYAWVCKDMELLDTDLWLKVECPDGKNYRTMRNCVVRQLQRFAPMPLEGHRWTSQTVTEDDGSQTLAIYLLPDTDKGAVASWAYGGSQVIS